VVILLVKGEFRDRTDQPLYRVLVEGIGGSVTITTVVSNFVMVVLCLFATPEVYRLVSVALGGMQQRRGMRVCVRLRQSEAAERQHRQRPHNAQRDPNRLRFVGDKPSIDQCGAIDWQTG